jgi:hypothetical protein
MHQHSVRPVDFSPGILVVSIDADGYPVSAHQILLNLIHPQKRSVRYNGNFCIIRFQKLNRFP